MAPPLSPSSPIAAIHRLTLLTSPVETDKVKLRGALATIVPADKKLLHGMSDAILVPSQFAER